MHRTQFGIAIILLAALFVGFWSWANRTPSVATEGEVPHILAGTSTAAGDFEYKEVGKYYEVSARYPADTALSGAADSKAQLTIEQALADRIAEFKRNTKVEQLTPEEAAFQNLGEGRKYSISMEYRAYTAPSYVSYLYTLYEDTGGAHPNSYFLTFVFDKEGNTVELPSLFSPNENWLQTLATEVTAQVEAQYKTRTNVESVEGLLFTDGLAPKEENFENFVVDGSDLRIFIPPYQVAAYAAGSFEVKIPLQ